MHHPQVLLLQTPHLQLVGFPESSLRRGHRELSVLAPVCMRSSCACAGGSRGEAGFRGSHWRERQRPGLTECHSRSGTRPAVEVGIGVQGLQQGHPVSAGPLISCLCS